VDFWLYRLAPALFGRPVSDTIWFLIPSMERTTEPHCTPGPISYNIAWVLLTFVGILGIRRFYVRKWLTGLLYLVTGGLLLLGVLYDFWTLNPRLSEENRRRGAR
jgi:hypothetical protein